MRIILVSIAAIIAAMLFLMLAISLSHGNTVSSSTQIPTQTPLPALCNGSVSFDPNIQVCCGGWNQDNHNQVIYTKQVGYKCCGMNYYNYSNEDFGCCEPNNNYLGFGEVYNRKTQDCYTNGQIKSTCRGIVCQQGWECCDDADKGPICYNPETHCCTFAGGWCFK